MTSVGRMPLLGNLKNLFPDTTHYSKTVDKKGDNLC